MCYWSGNRIELSVSWQQKTNLRESVLPLRFTSPTSVNNSGRQILGTTSQLSVRSGVMRMGEGPLTRCASEIDFQRGRSQDHSPNRNELGDYNTSPANEEGVILCKRGAVSKSMRKHEIGSSFKHKSTTRTHLASVTDYLLLKTSGVCVNVYHT